MGLFVLRVPCRDRHQPAGGCDRGERDRVVVPNRTNRLRLLSRARLSRGSRPMKPGVRMGTGFRLVDVRVTLAWAPADLASGVNAPVGSDGGVRPVTPDDVATLCAIARVNHRVTRFYNDPGFPTVRCDALYETWIRKSCDGDADAVFVYESGGAAIGYLTCHLDDDRRGRIGLAGLAPEARARGFGGSLLQAAQRWFVEHDVAVVTVVSQGRNREGQRLYQRYGFITDDTALWFHRWFSGSPGAKR